MKDRISMKWKQMEILCIIIVSFFLILSVRMMYQPNATSEANSFVSLSSGWYQIKTENEPTLSFLVLSSRILIVKPFFIMIR